MTEYNLDEQIELAIQPDPDAATIKQLIREVIEQITPEPISRGNLAIQAFGAEPVRKGFNIAVKQMQTKAHQLLGDTNEQA